MHRVSLRKSIADYAVNADEMQAEKRAAKNKAARAERWRRGPRKQVLG